MSADQICLNPWDVQSHRIYSPDGTYHCLFSADRSGQMTDGVCYAIGYRKSTKPGNGAVETWVQDDITNTLNGYEFHSPVRTPEVVVFDARGNGEGG